MGFLSYNLHYYQTELQKLKAAPAAQDSLYHTRQLLRMLDDLTTEGYTELNKQLENEFSGVSRLREHLKRNHAAPFSSPETPAGSSCLPYAGQDIELCAAILQAMHAAATLPDFASNLFADNLHRFCQWIGYDERTAYIFSCATRFCRLFSTPHAAASTFTRGCSAEAPSRR